MKKKILIVLASLVSLFILVGIIAIVTSGESEPLPTSQPVPSQSIPTSTATYSLQLVSTNYERAYDYITMSGEVRNITNKNLENVMAVVSYYTNDGAFVKTDDALIDYNPILPNQTSPFSVITTDNPSISRFKVEFKFLFGGTISTEDKR